MCHKARQCLRAEVIYEASISYQGGSRCLQKALRMTLWECEQIHQSGLSLRPKVLSSGWPSLEFHHWDMEHNCECVLKDKGTDMPGEWWSECVCKCTSHVVTLWHSMIHSFATEHLYELHLVEGFVTNDSLLSPTFPACTVLTLRTPPPLHPPFLSTPKAGDMNADLTWQTSGESKWRHLTQQFIQLCI